MTHETLQVIAVMFTGLGILLGLAAICAVISNRFAPTIDASNVLTGGDES